MRLLIFPLVVLSAAALISWIFADRLVFPEEYDDVVAWLRTYGSTAWLVGIAVILGDALLPVPSTPAMFAMGIIYGPVLGGLICGVSLVAAGFLGFLATRMLGRRAVLFLIGEDDLERTERFYERWGLYAIVIGRAIGGPVEWVVILAGLSKLASSKVFLALCAGGMTTGFVMAALGSMSVAQPLVAIAISSVLVLAMLFLGHRLIRGGDGA